MSEPLFFETGANEVSIIKFQFLFKTAVIKFFSLSCHEKSLSGGNFNGQLMGTSNGRQQGRLVRSVTFYGLSLSLSLSKVTS